MTFKSALNSLLFFFYRRLSLNKVLSFQVYSYLVIGVFNTLLNGLIFHLFYYYILLPLHAEGYMPSFFQLHSVALLLAFCCSMPMAFWLTKTFTFQGSSLATKQQFFRYAYVLSQGLFFEYLIVRLFVEVLNIEATLSKFSASGIVAFGNFFLQKYFTFKKSTTDRSASGRGSIDP